MRGSKKILIVLRTLTIELSQTKGIVHKKIIILSHERNKHNLKDLGSGRVLQ